MWRTRLIAAAVILILGGGGYLVWRLTHPPLSDEEQIARLIDRVEQGVEKKSPRMILANIADDYRDPFGFTKRDIYRSALSLLRTEGSLQVVLSDVEIAVNDADADVAVTGEVMLTEGGEQSQAFRGALTIHLRERDGKWLVTSATGWQSGVTSEFD